MRARAPRRIGPAESGAIAVLASIVLAVVAGFAALSLAVAHKMTVKTQLQAALDGGALAGAISLDGTAAGLADAQRSGLRIATLHPLDATTVAIALGDVVPGYWDSRTRLFSVTGDMVSIGGTPILLAPSTTPQYYNAVRVTGGADGQAGHNSPLEVMFASFVGGADSLRVGTQAIAVGGGPCSDDGCTLPLAVPSCSLVDEGGRLACGQTFTLGFNHGHGKDVAFADLEQPSNQPTPPRTIAQLLGAQTCGNPTVKVGDLVRLSNGDFFDAHVESSFRGPNLDLVCSSGPPYTGCPRRQIPVVNAGIICDAPLNQEHEVVGFASIVILGTRSTPGSERSIDVYLDCSGVSEADVGCASFGITSRRVRLGQ
jgi:Flp pilus assembly protein TadG